MGVMDASLDDLEQQSARRRIRPRVVVVDESIRIHDTLDNLILMDTEPNTYESSTMRCSINVTVPYSRARTTRYTRVYNLTLLNY